MEGVGIRVRGFGVWTNLVWTASSTRSELGGRMSSDGRSHAALVLVALALPSLYLSPYGLGLRV